jgi:hypothetical protein
VGQEKSQVMVVDRIAKNDQTSRTPREPAAEGRRHYDQSRCGKGRDELNATNKAFDYGFGYAVEGRCLWFVRRSLDS